jgi:hypothetical protein
VIWEIKQAHKKIKHDAKWILVFRFLSQQQDYRITTLLGKAHAMAQVFTHGSLLPDGKTSAQSIRKTILISIGKNSSE